MVATSPPSAHDLFIEEFGLFIHLWGRRLSKIQNSASVLLFISLFSSKNQDFAVICDDSNNTPEVVDRNEFRGDIYVKPSRSINFIQLQFVAVRSGVEFAEIIG